MIKFRLRAVFSLIGVLFWGISGLSFSAESPDVSYPQFPESIMQAIADAKNGDVIVLPAGKFSLNRSITLRAKNVVLKGMGADVTVIDASHLMGSPQALLVKGSNITLRDFSIFNPPSDGIKSIGCSGLSIKQVYVSWPHPGKKDINSRGGYGIYPVLCRDVTISHTKVSGALDSAIYIGQSQKVIIESNEVSESSRGIEVQNSLSVVVKNNKVFSNAVGIFLDGHIGLQNTVNRYIKISSNQVVGNNNEYFSGKNSNNSRQNQFFDDIYGVGIYIVGTQDVEVVANNLLDNNKTPVLISDFPRGKPAMADDVFNPYALDILLTGNNFGENKFGSVWLWDGGLSYRKRGLCMKGNFNLFKDGGFEKINIASVCAK